MKGKEVAILVNEQKPVGDYSVEWNANGLSEGIYFCLLQSGQNSETIRIIKNKSLN